MKKFISFVAFASAAALLAACGNPKERMESVDFIVVEASVVKPEACYLRIRRADEPNGPTTLVSYRRGQSEEGIYQRAFNNCAMMKAGDKIVRHEMVAVDPES